MTALRPVQDDDPDLVLPGSPCGDARAQVGAFGPVRWGSARPPDRDRLGDAAGEDVRRPVRRSATRRSATRRSATRRSPARRRAA
ncbi:hypothetical protein ACRAKI_29160 [Saccharothrix isguenensis]